MKALNGLWEVRYDPYDAGRVWIRNHHDGGWITAYWRHLSASPQPFGDDIWEYGRQIVAGRGITSPSEDEIKTAVDNILDKASPPVSPRKRQRKDQRAAARNTAAVTAQRPRPHLDQQQPEQAPAPKPDAAGEPSAEQEEDAPKLAKIIPLKIYDPHKEAETWW